QPGDAAAGRQRAGHAARLRPGAEGAGRRRPDLRRRSRPGPLSAAVLRHAPLRDAPEQRLVALSPPAVDAPAPPAGASSSPSLLHPVPALSLDALRAAVVDLGQPAYRAQQVSGWLYRSSAAGFEAMTNVPLALRRALAERYRFSALETVTERVSSDGETRK